MNIKEQPRGELIGHFYAWWRSDPLHHLTPLPGLSIQRPNDPTEIEALTGLDRPEVLRRHCDGHHLYSASVNGTPAAWGWSAWVRGFIGDLALFWELPPRNHYLWDFVTRPEWRGRGLYPRLLQAILRREAGDAERFWIGHDANNAASERGMLKAGFQRVSSLYLMPGGSLGSVAVGPRERAEAGASLVGVPLLNGSAEASPRQ